MQPLAARLRSFFSSSTWAKVPLHERRLFIGIMVVHFLLSGWFISRLHFTADESDYYGYAIRWRHGDMERVRPTDDSKSPIVAPSLLPNLIKPWVDLSQDPHGFKMLQLGRWCMYVFQWLGAFVLFCWLYRLLGARQWVLPLVLYLADPTVFSYGMIVGSDMACASLVVASAYLLWRYTATGSWKYWIWMCMAAGLALVAKASMIYLPVLLVTMLLGHGGVHGQWRKKTFWRQSAAGIFLLLLTGWLMVCAAYQFNQLFFDFADFPAKSDAFQSLQLRLGHWRVPLPYHYVAAFDLLQYHAQLGGGPYEANTFVGVSILNHYAVRGPVWYYYLAAFACKLPTITLLLLFTTVWFGWQKFLAGGWRRHWMLWVPPLFFFLLLSFTNPFQIGIRHALMVFPFLYLAIAAGLPYWLRHKPRLFRGLLALQLVFLVMYWPNMIAYTSEWVWPKRKVYRYLNDSSVSYQHAQPYLQRFLALHPAYKVPGKQPAAGKFAVLMEYLAAPNNAYGYDWLLKHCEPVGHYQFSVALFEVSEQDLQRIRATAK